VAEAAIEHGAIVVVASSRQANIDKTIKRIREQYSDAEQRIQGKTVDLSAEDLEQQISALYDFATENGKHKLDHIVSTAGDSFALVGLTDLTPQQVQNAYKVRMVGSITLAKVGLKYLNKSPTSSITFTTGVNCTKPSGRGWAALAPVGTAIVGLVHALAHEMKPIRVNCVSPGAVHTELFDSFAGDKLEEVLAMYRAKTLTDTVGKPEDLAECYVSIMKNAFLTGREIAVDGGYLLC
jgi:NAD(P)-dependent dehydrogenase (short-subunit alcohol dehydrogenase family)